MKTIFFIAAIIPIFCFSQFKVPQKMNGYVHDYDGVLSSDQVSSLNSLIKSYTDTSTNQIAVVILSDLQGSELSEVSLSIGREWGVGIKGKDNGVVYLISPKLHKSRIEVGTGLESTLSDLRTSRIQDDAKPYFRNNDYYGGISTSIQEIIKYSGQSSMISPASDTNHPWLFIIFIAAGAIIGIVFIFSRKRRQKEKYISDIIGSGSSIADTFLLNSVVQSHYNTFSGINSANQARKGLKSDRPTYIPTSSSSKSSSSSDSSSSSSSSYSSFDFGSSGSSYDSGSSSSDSGSSYDGGSFSGGGSDSSW